VPRMKRLFSGTVQVHYSAMYFQGAASGMPEGGQYFEGQVNGLCGAGGRSYLLLMTGLHTGGVKVTIDFWDGEPPLDDSWEEVVEVSFVVDDPEYTGILGWEGRRGLPSTYGGAGIEFGIVAETWMRPDARTRCWSTGRSPSMNIL
jgi:hypothetical protein